MEHWRARIEAVVAAGGPPVVFQPIVELVAADYVTHVDHEPTSQCGHRVLGYEALSRFPDEAVHAALAAASAFRVGPTHVGVGPDVWFAQAQLLGLGVDLELAAIRAAIRLWAEPRGAYLAVNASPDTVMSRDLPHAIDGCDRTQLLVELTEHFPVEDYEPLVTAIRRLRGTGCGACVRIAVDDWGAGEATYRHVLELEPDVVKIDVALTAELDAPTARGNNQRAIVRGLVTTAARLDVKTQVAAEGVEREAQAEQLRALGADYGQGWLFGRPGPLPGRVGG